MACLEHRRNVVAHAQQEFRQVLLLGGIGELGGGPDIFQPRLLLAHVVSDDERSEETVGLVDRHPLVRIGKQEVIEIGEFVGGKRCREWHLWILKKDKSKLRMIRGRENNPPSSQFCERIAS